MLQQQRNQDEGREAAQFVRYLRQWNAVCMLCFVVQQDGRKHRHTPAACPSYALPEIRSLLAPEETEMEQLFRVQRSAVRFSGCFRCHAPQALCTRWREQPAAQGGFEEIPGAMCPYEGLMEHVVTVYRAAGWAEEALASAFRVVQRQGAWVKEGDYRGLLVSRVRWGGYEANGLCILFWAVCEDVEKNGA